VRAEEQPHFIGARRAVRFPRGPRHSHPH
jgi:hypothetical protein